MLVFHGKIIVIYIVRDYNGITMVLQWYYNGITMVLGGAPPQRGGLVRMCSVV